MTQSTPPSNSSPPTRKPIVVVGSVNMDLVCRVRQLPEAGQTILGTGLATIPGGKGANQAVAAARLGAPVTLVARVGDDDFGQRLLNGLQQHQVDTQFVTVTEGIPSGCALILVDRKGENTIIVAPGANHKLSPQDVDAAEDVIRSAAVVVMQLEIPRRTVMRTLNICRSAGVYTILDPSPASAMTRGMYAVDLLTPNTLEAQALLKRRDPPPDHKPRVARAEAKQIASDLLARGPRAVALKMGSRGALLMDRDEVVERCRPLPVKVVDTTAAGDAFTGALAVAISEGLDLRRTLHFACAAGACACQQYGAQPSLPTREAVETLLKKRA